MRTLTKRKDGNFEEINFEGDGEIGYGGYSGEQGMTGLEMGVSVGTSEARGRKNKPPKKNDKTNNKKLTCHRDLKTRHPAFQLYSNQSTTHY